jgi:uncharacterized membrane protein
MFLGHYGLALATKHLAPRASLGTLTFSANLADCLWPVLLLLGLERVRVVPGLMAASALDFESYPWTHSLATGLALGVVVGLVHFALRRDAWTALVVGALVPSHWLLDLPFHRPDLPLWPGGPQVGLGLWNSLPLTLVLEAVAFLGGAWLYARRTRAVDRTGTWALVALVAFLVLVYLGSMFGPPPADARGIGWSGLALWLFVPWTVWIDRHRALV